MKRLPPRTPLTATLSTLLVAGALALAGCGGGGDQAQAQGGRPGGRPGGPPGGGPGGRPEQPPAPVAVEAAHIGPIASYYTANATLEAEKEAEVLARVSGVVMSLACEEGDRVRSGQTLLRIQDDEYRLRVAQAEATLEKQKARFDRLDGMFKQGLASAEEHEAARNDFLSAEAEAGLARLNLSYTDVTSPFAGRVVRRHVDPGQNVSPGTPLFTVSDFEPLLARVHVPSKEFRSIRREQPVELALDSNRQLLKGRITLVSPVIDPTTGTIKVTVEIDRYPDDVRPGDFAEVRIVTEAHENALLVPKIAVVSEKGEQVVYVAADGTAERRTVEIGFQDDRFAEILGGVTEGEPVIVRGQRSLKHGAPVKVMDDEAPSESAEASPGEAGS